MIVWIIWQHDFIDGHSQQIDSIWTDRAKALSRLIKVNRDNTDDRMSDAYIAEIELDYPIYFDLDITLSRDNKGIPILTVEE